MANGRQRRLAARRKIAERAKRNDSLAGLSADALTNIISDDNNDLDEVSFTTTDGAKVSMKNQRGKNEDGGTVRPKINTLGTTYGGGPTQMGPLGQSFSGGPTFTGYPTPDPELPEKQPDAITAFIGEDLSMPDNIGTNYSGGPTHMGPLGTTYGGGSLQAGAGPDLDFSGQELSTDDFGNVLDKELQADILAEQMNRSAFGNEDFLGTEVLQTPNAPIGTSYGGGATQSGVTSRDMQFSDGFSGGPLQNNRPNIDNIGTNYSGGPTQIGNLGTDYSGGPTFTGYPEPEWDPVMPQNAFDELDGYAMADNPALPENADIIEAQMNRNAGFDDSWQDVIASDAQTNAQDMRPIGTSYPGGPLQEGTPDALGFPDQADKARAQAEYDQRLAEEDMAAQMRGPIGTPYSGGPLQDSTMTAREKAQAQRELRQNPDILDFPEEEVTETEIPAVTDPLLTPEGTPIRQGAQTLEEAAQAAGAVNADGTMDQDWVDTQFPDNYDGIVANEAEKANSEIIAATAGDPQAAAVVKDAKDNISKLKEAVESGATTIDEAKEAMSSSFGQLGELLGIDKKDLVRALFRFGGAMVFGSSANAAAKFAYEGWTTDNSDTVLGKDATAKQRNLAAYNKEVKTLDAKVAAGQITQEAADAQKKIVDQIYSVNKKQTMGRPVNIKGISKETGAEEVIAGRRNENNSYDVFLDGQWVPIEEAGLEEIQITGRGAEQAFEKGVKDPRTGVGIDNATYVSSTGVPTFTFKTGDARKAYQLAKRSVDSFPVIEAMMSDPKNVKALTSAMGGLATYAAGHANDSVTAASINLALGDSLPQKFKSATSAWLQALLRADTGAAYSETEIMDYIATNIPQVGDTQETVEFKLQQMKSTTETMAANATQGSKYLLGRLDGSIQAPDAVKRMHEMAKGPKSTTKRSTELQSALDLY